MNIVKKQKNIRSKFIVTFAQARQNPSIPKRKEKKEKKEKEEKEEKIIKLELKNKFGSFFISGMAKTGLIDDTDIKNFIVICNVYFDFFKDNNLLKKSIYNLSKEELHIERNALKDGIIIPMTEIIKYRQLKKEGSVYNRVKESLEKFSKTRINIAEMSVNKKGGKDKINKGWLNLTPTIVFLEKKDDNMQESIMQESILVQLHGTIYEAIRMGEIFFVDRKILNSLSGIAVNLYIMLEREHLKKVSQKHFSYRELIQESRFLFTKTGKKRPDRAKEKINKALNQMKRKKAIANWEEITMSRGEDGVKILWE